MHNNNGDPVPKSKQSTTYTAQNRQWPKILKVSCAALGPRTCIDLSLRSSLFLFQPVMRETADLNATEHTNPACLVKDFRRFVHTELEPLTNMFTPYAQNTDVVTFKSTDKVHHNRKK